MSDPYPREHPSESPLPDLAAAITAGAVRLAAATAAWLRLIAEFDRRDGWHGYGIMSCAHWLAWQCGLSPGAAREHVRVARSLQSLPLIEAAFSSGRLSYSKVRALTRIAEPDSEASLLDVALELTASQVERTVRQWRRADARDAHADLFEYRPSFEYWWDEHGMLNAKMRLPAEEGAAFVASIESLAERAARRERAREKKARGATEEGPAGHGRTAHEEIGLARERTEARRIAALTALAEAAADADRRAGDPPRREVVVHVDAAVLADDAASGRAYLEGGPALHPRVVRRMLCGASVVTMLEENREPLAVGRRKRRATKAQRTALLRRDGGCARPGCPEARIERLHAHHLRHWLFGGRTDVPNLVLLCDRDHGLVHDLDLVMTRRDGALIVTAPDGRRVWGQADAAFSSGLDGLDAPAAAGSTARTTGSPACIPSTPRRDAHRRIRDRRGRRRVDRTARLPRRVAAPLGAAAPAGCSDAGVRARRHRSVPRSFPGASRTCPMRCPSTASAWTSATSWAFSWATATWSAASPRSRTPARSRDGTFPREPQMFAPSAGGPSGSGAANPEPEVGGLSMPTV